MAMTAYKPSTIAPALRALIEVRRPGFLWGPPGIGKSKVMAQVAQSLDLELRDVRATLLDPVDLRGLPQVAEGVTRWLPPTFLPREGRGVFFLDELNAAPPSVQVACYQLVLDRRLGEYTLPEGWTVMAAGNRLNDGASALRMPSALANRFVHLEMAPDLDDWCGWAMGAGVDPVLVAFMRYRPNLLHSHEPNERAYPTPRSWEFVGEIIRDRGAKGERGGGGGAPRGGVELALIEGAVGKGAGTEFIAFLDLYRKLPNIDSIIAHPERAEVPQDPATRYAVTYALASRAKAENWRSVLSYFDRLPEEYSVLGVKHATTRDGKLAQTHEFTEWAVKHAHIMS